MIRRVVSSVTESSTNETAQSPRRLKTRISGPTATVAECRSGWTTMSVLLWFVSGGLI